MPIKSFVAVAAISMLVATTSTNAKDWKTVRIGTDATYPPFETVNSDGKLVGFEIDYANALCSRMNVTCTFQNQDWDGLILALLTGKFDAIFSSMTVTAARQKMIIFSNIYYVNPTVFAGKTNDNSNDVSPVALKGKAIGTQGSTTFSSYLNKFYKNSEIRLYPTLDEANLDLASGRIDYVLGETIVEKTFIDTKGNGCCRLIATIKRDPETLGLGVAAAFRPNDTDLCKMFNKAIDELDADGTYEKLSQKYFGEDIRGR
jgi:polar amino acid transport system substrate-binding protein